MHHLNSHQAIQASRISKLFSRICNSAACAILSPLPSLLSILLLSVTSLHAQDALPSLNFTAAEAQLPYYQMGWDTAEEAANWTYSTQASGNFTWHLEENTPYNSQPPFSSIDPDSRYSLCVRYSNYDTQYERATSPDINILPNTTLECYACFRAVFLVYADWKIIITDSRTQEQLLQWSAFQWAQQNAFTGPSWQKISLDLSSMHDKTVNITFLYTGPGGEDLAIDGLRLYQSIQDDNATITINEGQYVHFINTTTPSSLLSPLSSFLWTFPGGIPETSTELNPIVNYPTAGSYSVTLTLLEDTPKYSLTREAYVNVLAQPPHALIGLPDEGYLSPWTALFLAPGQTVTYHDLSTGKPSTWQWTFQGAEPQHSQEQNPTVTYPEEGLYGLTLDVTNQAGTSSDFMVDAIQVGGSQYIWNIGLDEYDSLSDIPLGWYGYYAGSNWLGMHQFAEHFLSPPSSLVSPLSPQAYISEVQVYFYGTETISPDAVIPLALCLEDQDGQPGQILAQTAITAQQIAYDPQTILPTTFTFQQPVNVNTPFFIVIGPFPNATDPLTGQTDAISILAMRRQSGQKSTTWHLLEDEDPKTYQPLGTYHWFENTDDPVSLCITPLITYDNVNETTNIHQYTSPAPPSSLLPPLSSQTYTPAGIPGHGTITIVRHNDGTVTKNIRK